MRKIIRFIGRALKVVGFRLQELGTVRYYYDHPPTRDPVVSELCQQLMAGKPWSEVIRDPRTLEHGERLPEYTYVCEAVRHLQPGALLDVGCVLNNAAFDPFIPNSCDVAFLNPASEPIARRKATYFKSPLAEFAGKQFPLVTCLSTLEHIGFDNTRYGTTLKDEGWDWPQAIACIVQSVEQLATFVAPGGRLIVTCPYGRKEFAHLPPKTGVRVWQVLHTEHVAALLASPKLPGLRVVTLRVGNNGWEQVPPDADFAPFGDIVPGASGLIILDWHAR